MQYLGLVLLFGAVAEIISIVLMADWIGGWATFGLMVLSFAVGLFVLRRTAGLAKVLMAGEMMRGSGMSFYQMMWPVRIPAAALLLMLPGFASSLAAVLLLLPFKGKTAAGGVHGKVFRGGPFGQTPNNTGDVIDSEDYVVRGGGRKNSAGKEKDVIEHRP